MIDEILESRGLKLKKKTAGEYCCPCPFCGGSDRFCVWPKEGRYWCRQCKRTGDDIQLLRELENMSFNEAKEAVGRNDPRDQGDKQKPTKKSTEPFVHPELGKPEKVYHYTDENGKDLFCVCKWGEGKNKQFSQCKPDGLIWTIKGVRRVLYTLPGIINQKSVAFAEGEKDVESLRALGLPATTCMGGTGQIKKLSELHQQDKLFDALNDKTVYIFPDNDAPGRQYAEKVASLLFGIAKTIKIVHLPDMPEGGDVSDFIDREGDKAKSRIMELIASAPVWTPPKPYFTLQDLYDLPTENHLPIIDGGILPFNSHILIAGESGVGKSLLRLELAIHLAMGWDWMGFKIPKARSVAIFQYENSEHTEKFRVKRMLYGLGMNVSAIGDRIRYATREERFNLTLKGDREKLLKKVKELGCEVVIYDCLSNLHNAKENDNIKMREVLDVLCDINAQLKTSCIVIHHFGKPGENPESVYRIRGASSINDWAYTVMTFTRKKHEEKTLRKIEFTKVRDGREPKPFYVERDPEAFLCSFYDEESIAPPNVIAEILQEQFSGSVEKQKDFVTAIMSKTGCGEKTARVAVKRAVEMHSIYEYGSENKKTKGYRLPMSGQC